MLIELPNGILEGADHFNYVELDELRGKQQNYLIDRELVEGNIGHIPKILQDMVKSIETKEGLKYKGNMSDVIDKLPSGDLETILIKLRENTYGPEFFHGAKCEHCEHEIKNLKLLLSDLKTKKISIEELSKKRLFKLNKSQSEIEFKPLYLKDIFKLIKFTKNNTSTLFTSLMTLNIKSITDKEGNVIEPVLSKHIDDLPITDLTDLQTAMDGILLEGSIDTELEIECPKCDTDFAMKLNVFEPLFLSPSRLSKS